MFEITTDQSQTIFKLFQLEKDLNYLEKKLGTKLDQYYAFLIVNGKKKHQLTKANLEFEKIRGLLGWNETKLSKLSSIQHFFIVYIENVKVWNIAKGMVDLKKEFEGLKSDIVVLSKTMIEMEDRLTKRIDNMEERLMNAVTNANK